MQRTSNSGANWSTILSQYVEFTFGATPAAGSVITSVVFNSVFKASANANNTAQYLLVSGDSGTAWTAFNMGNLAGTTFVTFTQNVSSVINTATKLSDMKIRYFANNSAGAYKHRFDFVQVRVN